jgi:hypothetical protein
MVMAPFENFATTDIGLSIESPSGACPHCVGSYDF